MSDNTIRMQYSDDGQPNFSNWQARPIGEVGQYGLRIVWTRMGRTRQRVYRFQCSSPRRRDLLSAAANIQQTDG